MSRIARILFFFALTLCLVLPGAFARAQDSLVDEVEEIRLDNGLRIFVLERDFSPTFVAGTRWPG